MKKLVLTALAVCFCCMINAQDDKQQSNKIRFGAKAGLNFANATGNIDRFLGEPDGETRFGLLIGGFVDYKLSQKFSLQAEVAYSQEGVSKKYSDEDYEVIAALNYLNVSITPKYYVTDKLNFEVGPQLGFLLNAKFKEKQDGERFESDAKRFLTSTNLSVNIGAGYQLENGFGVAARYNLGLTDIYDFSFNLSERKENVTTSIKESDEDFRQAFEMKTGVFNISLFYTF